MRLRWRDNRRLLHGRFRGVIETASPIGRNRVFLAVGFAVFCIAFIAVTIRESAKISFAYGEPPISIAAMPCPTVFIYEDLPLFPGDIDGDLPPRNIAAAAFGSQYSAGVAANTTFRYDTRQMNLVPMFIYRLLHSSHCKVTRDPLEADLFMIPAMSANKGDASWGRACTSTFAINSITAPLYLPHLNERTALRHFAFVGNSANRICNGTACAWLRGEEPLFSAIQRFAYTSTFPDLHCEAKRGVIAADGRIKLDGRILSVPVPSGIHWSAMTDKPWMYTGPRTLLVFFIAKFHGLQDVLRRKLFSQCNELGPPLCQAVQHFSHDAMFQKQRSVFCLEPEGDAVWRKSTYDSITSGCIPVLFSATTDALSPWHWVSSIREKTRLLYSEEDFLSGNTTLQVLRDIPPERIAAMQAAIRTHAHRLHWALEDYPTGDDAFEVLLKKAHLRARGVPWDAPEMLAEL
jgi:hypothetical protein